MNNPTKPSVLNWLLALGIAAVGVALAAFGIHVGEIDDAPGAALLGIALMLGAVALAVKIARRKSPPLQDV